MSSTSTGADGSAGRHGPGADEVALTVARIGAPRGLRGEVRLDVRTDTPRSRLAIGTVLRTDPPAAGPLTVAAVRDDSGSWFVRFAEVRDRAGAEALSGVALLLPPAEPEEDAWYSHELVGFDVVLLDGSPVGTVEGFEHLPAHDLLVVREQTGERSLVPFVHAIVPVIDEASRRVVLDPPGGLLAQVPGTTASDDVGTTPGPDEPVDGAAEG